MTLPRPRHRAAVPLLGGTAALLAACGGSDVTGSLATPALPAVTPQACSVFTPEAVATALAPAPPSATSSASPSPAGPPPTGPLPSRYYAGTIQVGTKVATGGQCTYTAADGSRLVVSVLEKTTLASVVSGGTPLGPAVAQSADGTTLIALPTSAGSLVEAVLDDSALSDSQRTNRLAALASTLPGVTLPTVPETAVNASTSATTGPPAPVTVAAPGHKVTGQTAAVTVNQTDALQFSPTAVTVASGRVVEWMNSGQVQHNVTFDDYPDITSATMSGGQTFEVQFTKPGTYQYHCTFHPGMNGTVTVS